jgi:hypothetical protein
VGDGSAGILRLRKRIAFREPMLLKDEIIDQIKDGTIAMLFRRWSRPGAKAGGTQVTQGGVIGIDSVEVVTEDEITEMDAREAGFISKDILLSHLSYRDDPIYRMRVYFVGEDPRKTLRENDDLSKTELDKIIAKLKKLDNSSKRGSWTEEYLQLIHDQPNTYSGILAKSLGLDIPHFKPWVRKLKALGLTESLRPGYRLSPRGQKVLEALRLRR